MTTAQHNLAGTTIGQLLIPVKQLERATAFYRDTLGLPFLFSAPPRMSFFQVGDVRLLLSEPEPGQTMPGAPVIYFRVRDIQAVAGSLRDQGVEIRTEAHVVHRTPTMELWLCEFVDAEGNTMCLMSEVATENSGAAS